MKHQRLSYRPALLAGALCLALTGRGPATDPNPEPDPTQADTVNTTTEASKENNNMTFQPHHSGGAVFYFHLIVFLSSLTIG